MYKLLNWAFFKMENFFHLNNDSILEDSSEFNYRNRRRNFLGRRKTWKPQWPCVYKRKLQKSLETLGFRGRQDHYDAYVEDFSIFQMADDSKVVEFKENPTKTRQGGLRIQHAALLSRCGRRTEASEIPLNYLKSGWSTDLMCWRNPVRCTWR